MRAGSGPPPQSRPVWRIVLGVLAVCAALGVPAGAVWAWTAPDVVLIVSDGQLRLGSAAGQAMFAVDAVFGLIAGAAGMTTAVLTWYRFGPHRPITTVLLLAVGGLVGSLVAFTVGRRLGPSPPGSVAGLPDGARVVADLSLHALGVALVWSITALTLVFVAAVMEPRRHHPATGTDRPSGSPLAPVEGPDPDARPPVAAADEPT